MTNQQAVELIQMHHPDASWQQIRILINERLKRLCEASGLLRGWEEETTVANQIYYPLSNIDTNIVNVLKVRYEGSDIERETDIPPHGTDTALLTPISGE